MLKVFKQDPDDKKVKRLYHQRYRAEWEKIPAFSAWLRSSNDGYSAHCIICDANVLARLASIKQHLITRKHQESSKCNAILSQVGLSISIRNGRCGSKNMWLTSFY
ncbi:hypothetical protein M5D96_004060 [Drosophila gunungcola]|uniref:Uncharacterized protein n=1 Tax=Drosophila gunungcola TaxID=103775 RepID=A0A9Q0BS52_9MUSC|nr:hypothetical protein M5D96_004060 [Drosophila gunungcola]